MDKANTTGDKDEIARLEAELLDIPNQVNKRRTQLREYPEQKNKLIAWVLIVILLASIWILFGMAS